MSFPSYRAVSKIGFCHITFCESTDLEKSNMFGKKNSLLSLVNKRQVLPPLPLGVVQRWLLGGNTFFNLSEITKRKLWYVSTFHFLHLFLAIWSRLRNKMTRLRILTGPHKTFKPTSSSQIKSNATDNIKKHEVLIEIYKITNVMTKIISVLEISKTESIMESFQSKCNSILVSFWICLVWLEQDWDRISKIIATQPGVSLLLSQRIIIQFGLGWPVGQVQLTGTSRNKIDGWNVFSIL